VLFLLNITYASRFLCSLLRVEALEVQLIGTRRGAAFLNR
jgi:hypothetical protein